MTVFGTRPEIIRLAVIIKLLDSFCEQFIIHTGQNYDPNLSDLFFAELGVRQPDLHLGIKASGFASQAGEIISRVDEAMERFKPDRMLILGDTNSGLAAIPAARRGIPVFHLEAGNRCFDDRVPEEVNRRIIDHCSNILMPYTQRSAENLVREGIERHRIFVIGNPIKEVLDHYANRIQASEALAKLAIEPSSYFLATLHRAENVDDEHRLDCLIQGLHKVAEKYGFPVIVSLHPRTADKLQRFGIVVDATKIRLIKPLGFFDFVLLEQKAQCVISDSGTVQEECCIFGVPNVTIRDVTERPETIECGSNILAGADPDSLLRSVDVALSASSLWNAPVEYQMKNTSTVVAKIVLGYHHVLAN